MFSDFTLVGVQAI